MYGQRSYDARGPGGRRRRSARGLTPAPQGSQRLRPALTVAMNSSFRLRHARRRRSIIPRATRGFGGYLFLLPGGGGGYADEPERLRPATALHGYEGWFLGCRLGPRAGGRRSRPRVVVAPLGLVGTPAGTLAAALAAVGALVGMLAMRTPSQKAVSTIPERVRLQPRIRRRSACDPDRSGGGAGRLAGPTQPRVFVKTASKEARDRGSPTAAYPGATLAPGALPPCARPAHRGVVRPSVAPSARSFPPDRRTALEFDHPPPATRLPARRRRDAVGAPIPAGEKG
jgi:hypothetical protein